jgi:hypothetical protein
MFGNEKRIVRKNHEPRMQTAEMKFLLGLARYMRTDHRSSIEVREKIDFNLNITIQNYRNNWKTIEHLNWPDSTIHKERSVKRGSD